MRHYIYLGVVAPGGLWDGVGVPGTHILGE